MDGSHKSTILAPNDKESKTLVQAPTIPTPAALKVNLGSKRVTIRLELGTQDLTLTIQYGYYQR